jgi:acrylyl-CoA reductase (NADPH)
MKKIKKNKKLLIKKKNNRIKISIFFDNIPQLNKGEVLIKSSYSSINFKDLLVLKGNPGLVRRFPHTPGIDVSGIIIASKSKKFKIGQKVVVIARPMGLNNPGGFQEYVKVKENWVDILPKKISLKKSMIIGTAGFTAMFTALKIKRNNPKKKPILITGASGGVGIISIIILKSWGYKIVACIRNRSLRDKIKRIGADEVINHKDLINNSNLPLLKEKYSAIIDNVGGNALQSAYRQVEKKGNVYLIGNVSGEITKLYLLPFILRGIKLIGINTEMLEDTDRRKIFLNLLDLSKNPKLNDIYEQKKLNFLLNKNLINKKRKNIKRTIIRIK